MTLGYGYILGILAVTVLLRLLDVLSIPLNFLLVIGALISVTGFLLWWSRNRLPSKLFNLNHSEPGPCWERMIWILLLIWLSGRFLNLALELFWLPLFPWDAWSTWMVRPQAWLEAGQLLSFQDEKAWLNDSTGLVYHIEAWSYPLTVSLIALWSALAWGQWHENIVNFSWWYCGIALALAFYGQARIRGATPLQSMLFTWLLLSLPLLDVHIALAGYADLWMTTVFGLAAISFMQWTQSRDIRQGLLALFLSLFCPFIKQEGIMWLLLFFPALIVIILPRRYLIILSVMIIMIISGFLWHQGSWNVPGIGEFRISSDLVIIPYIGQLKIHYWNNWQAVIESFFILDNWHLLGYLWLIIIFMVTSKIIRGQRKDLHMATVLVLTYSVVFFMLFFFTIAGAWAKDFTSLNRIALHFTPALLFWILMVFTPPLAVAASVPADMSC